MKKIEEQVVYTGKWISVKELTLCDQNGKMFFWEMVERQHDVGGMVIISRLKPSNRVVLVRQYRPILENYIIGFPAGVAEREDIQQEALRELLEETGYYGNVIKVSPPLRSNPALFGDRVYIIKIEIDETDPRNAHPVQRLEPSEEIEVLLVDEPSIEKFLLDQKDLGDEIGIGPWYAFASN
jgi:ADP-ribose pyrophosphatase